MLFELNVSHIGVVPPDDLQQIWLGLAAEGNIGISIRLIECEAVIAPVEPKSPAAKARLRPGFVIQSLDGHTLEQSVAEG